MDERDPFYSVQGDVIFNMKECTRLATDLEAQLKRETSGITASTQAAAEVLQNKFSLIDADLQDLDETIDIVKNDPHRFSLTREDVRERQDFVRGQQESCTDLRSWVTCAVENHVFNVNAAKDASDRRTGRESPDPDDIKQTRSNGDSCPLSSNYNGAGGHRYIPLNHDFDRNNSPNELLRTATTDQTRISAKQDHELHMLNAALKRQKNIAAAINDEVTEQNHTLNAMEAKIDGIRSSLRRVTVRIDKVIDESSNGKKMIFIICLSVVLIVLVVLTLAT